MDIKAEAKSTSGLRQLELLAKLVELAPQFPGEQVQTPGFYNEGHLWGLDVKALDSDFSVLKSKEWIYYERSIAGIDDILILQAGKDVVEAFESERSDPVKRNAAVRNAFLAWLYEEYNADNDNPDTARFYESKHGKYLGSEISEREVKRAVDWLVDSELISVTPMLNAFTRPVITPKGVSTVELGGRAETALLEKGMSVTNVNISGSHGVNVAVDSSDVQQSNTVTSEQRERVNKFVGSAQAMLPGLELEQGKEAQALEVIKELEAEVLTEAPKQGRVKELIGKVIDIAVTGTATGMVNALVAMGESAMSSMG